MLVLVLGTDGVSLPVALLSAALAGRVVLCLLQVGFALFERKLALRTEVVDRFDHFDTMLASILSGHKGVKLAILTLHHVCTVVGIVDARTTGDEGRDNVVSNHCARVFKLVWVDNSRCMVTE